MRSEADNLITRFLQGYWIDDDIHAPPCGIASLYMDDIPATDLGRRLSGAYEFPVMRSIPEALTLGTGKLAVDGVLIVGDAGEPRRDRAFEFLRQTVDVFRSAGRSVPVYCAGFLSTDWDRAKRMVQWSRDLRFPSDGRIVRGGYFPPAGTGLSSAQWI